MHEETFLTQEALQKAVEAMKLASVAPIHAEECAKDYAKYEDFLNYEI